MVAKIQFRRDNSGNWTSANTILAAGEFGYETDTGKAKIGDGTTTWTNLGYTIYTPSFSDILNTPTTLAGYGITDAFSGSFSALTGKPTTIAGYGITDAFNGTFAALTGKPNTIAGYGIIDAVSTSYVTFANLAGKPTTISGYGITDAFDGAFSSLTGKPTTVAGYGITDALTSVSFSQITNKPITIAGYGIQDAFDGAFSSLGGKPTTLAGYGITDAFDGAFSSLSGKPTTLSGYGITDNVALLNNPTFTGTPAAPTASTGTNTTQLATTAFVQTAITPFASITAASQIYFQDGAPTIQALGEVWLDTNAGAFYKSIAGSATVPLDSSTVSASSASVTIPAAGASNTNLTLATGLPSGSITFRVPVFLESFSSSGVNDPTLGTLTYHDDTTQGVASNSITRSTGNALDKKVKSFTYSSAGTTNSSTSTMTITISGKPEWQVQESHVQSKVDAIIDSAPGALDTLNELAAALGDDANFSTTITNSLAAKAPLASPALTGTPTAPTASANTNTTQLATTAFVQQEIGTPFVKTDLSVTNSSTAAGAGALAYNNSSGVFTFVPPDLSSFLTTVAFSDLTGKPTTISGYGITDAFDGLFASLGSKPTTISGYGITDAFDGVFASLTNKPTTISGYGITDAFDGAFSSLSGKPTTISGYGITDALTLGTTATTALAGNTTFTFAQITSKPTTIAGYGITDAFSGAYSALSGIPSTIAHTNADIDIGSNDFITTGKVLFANLYANLSDLPSASTYHGMFAHVHATGAAYFAHAGNWIRLANHSSLFSGSFTALSNKPTTLAGYGITDAALIASPTFTGAPSAPTAASGTNTTQIATTAFVQQEVTAAGSYNDASVDTHLNRSTASTGEVLSWNGSDYDWVAQTGGGGGGASVTVSETAPSSPSQGDLWFDPSVLKTFVYYNDGTANQWVQSNPTGSGGGSGGGGASVSTSDTAPSSPSDGDLWYNTSTSGLFVYYQDADSSQWVEVVGSAGASTPARVTTSDTAPSSPTAGDLWYDTTDGGLFVYYADGTSNQWVEIVGQTGADGADGADGAPGSVTISDAAPSSPTVGQLWWNSSTNKLYIRYQDADSTQWVQATTPGATGPAGSTGATGATGAAGAAGAAGPASGRNAIINGDFQIWQRGTSFTASGYTADRWRLDTFGGAGTTLTQQSFTVGQTDVPNNPVYYLRAVTTTDSTSDAGTILSQRIEGARTFAGQTITVSFYAKANAAKDINIELRQDFGTGGSPSSQIAATTPQKFAITTSWAKYTKTFSVASVSGKTFGTNNNDYFRLALWLDAGSDYNSRTNSLGNQSGTFDFAQVQVEVGSSATDFEGKTYGETIEQCQRYYVEWSPTTNYAGIGIGRAWGSNNMNLTMYLPTRMRAQPSVSKTGSFDIVGISGGASGLHLDGWAYPNFLKLGVTGQSNFNTGANFFYQVEGTNNTNSRIHIDAEL